MPVDQETMRRMLDVKPNYEKKKTVSSSWQSLSVAVVVIFLIGLAYWYFTIPREPDWYVSPDGLIHYPKDRGGVVYNQQDIGSENDTLIKLNFESRGATIYGILRMPKTDGKVPGIVLLPGAGVTKEREQNVATALRDMGYATLTIDQRGIGETGGNLGDYSTNYQYFRTGSEPPLHEMIYDALRAYDLMRGREEIDSERIIFMGESMGGRIAIIAAAMEPGAKGALGMSTGGYGLGNMTPKDNLTLFQRSLDPDAYIGSISPRKVVIMHSGRDDVVRIENAEQTFSFANEPKRFDSFECSTHGYCDEMRNRLGEELAWFFGS